MKAFNLYKYSLVSVLFTWEIRPISFEVICNLLRNWFCHVKHPACLCTRSAVIRVWMCWDISKNVKSVFVSSMPQKSGYRPLARAADVPCLLLQMTQYARCWRLCHLWRAWHAHKEVDCWLSWKRRDKLPGCRIICLCSPSLRVRHDANQYLLFLIVRVVKCLALFPDEYI